MPWMGHRRDMGGKSIQDKTLTLPVQPSNRCQFPCPSGLSHDTVFHPSIVALPPSPEAHHLKDVSSEPIIGFPSLCPFGVHQSDAALSVLLDLAGQLCSHHCGSLTYVTCCCPLHGQSVMFTDSDGIRT